MKKHTYEFIKSFIENEGYILLSDEYINAHKKLKLKCPNNHIFEMDYHSFQRGRRCSICSCNQKLEYNNVKSFIENEGYKLLSKNYINNGTKLKLKCPNNHIFEMRFRDFKQGYQRCRRCSNSKGFSNSEKEVYNFIRSSYNGLIIENDRKTIRNPLTNRYLELDIYLPEINKAIEFNGERWHNKNNTIIRDKIKNEQCRKLGIDLMTIWFNDWMKNKNKIEEKLNNFIKEI